MERETITILIVALSLLINCVVFLIGIQIGKRRSYEYFIEFVDSYTPKQSREEVMPADRWKDLNVWDTNN